MAIKKYTPTCIMCGTEFPAARRHARFCSPKCKMAHHRGRKPVTDSEKVTPVTDSSDDLEAAKRSFMENAKVRDPVKTIAQMEAKLEARHEKKMKAWKRELEEETRKEIDSRVADQVVKERNNYIRQAEVARAKRDFYQQLADAQIRLKMASHNGTEDIGQWFKVLRQALHPDRKEVNPKLREKAMLIVKNIESLIGGK